MPLCSPIDGTIIGRSVSLGQAVQPATDAFAVANLSQLWVQLDLSKRSALCPRRSARGDPHRGLSRPELSGSRCLRRSGHRRKTRTAPVRVEFDNQEGLFRPGQFVTATLQGDPSRVKSEVLAVPRKAVLTVEGKPLVLCRRAVGLASAESSLGASRRGADRGANRSAGWRKDRRRWRLPAQERAPEVGHDFRSLTKIVSVS